VSIPTPREHLGWARNPPAGDPHLDARRPLRYPAHDARPSSGAREGERLGIDPFDPPLAIGIGLAGQG
jgi:hypothetical protein